MGQTVGSANTVVGSATEHSASGFAMSADRSSLLSGDCTSCEVKQDKSAYWTPALYFIDKWTGDAELVDEVGGLLVWVTSFNCPSYIICI